MSFSISAGTAWCETCLVTDITNYVLFTLQYRPALTKKYQNGCILNLVYGSNDSVSLYRIEERFCGYFASESNAKSLTHLVAAGGGGEYWNHYIEQKCVERIANGPGGPFRMTSEDRYELLGAFNKAKVGFFRGLDAKPFQFASPEGWRVQLSPNEIEDCFKNAHRCVFEEAKSQIETSSTLDSDPLVVISGGTAKHEGVRSQLKEICTAVGVSPPNFVEAPTERYR